MKEKNVDELKLVQLTAQEKAHENGEDCGEDNCEHCCGELVGHEYDDSEGNMCINCGAEYPY